MATVTDSQSSQDIPSASCSKPGWIALLGFLLVVLLISYGGWWAFNERKEDIRLERQNELNAIATLKAQQITEWRREKLRDTEILRHNHILAGEVETWLKRGAPLDRIHAKLISRLGNLRQAHNYHAMLLVDSSGKEILSVGEAYGIDAHGRETARQAMAEQQSTFADDYSQHLHKQTDEAAPHQGDHRHLDLFVPLRSKNKAGQYAVAVVVIRIDPEQFLLPLVESWPVQSSSAETVLLQATESGIIRLSDWRHQQDAKISSPPNEIQHPHYLVRNHQEGSVEHLDYRLIPTLSVVKHIEDSPWYLVAKIDQAEIYASIGTLAKQILLLVIALIFLCGLIFYYWWHQLRARYLAGHYQAMFDKQLLERRFQALSKHANDIILLLDYKGIIVEANDRAVELLGYPREQLIGLPFRKLLRQEDVEKLLELQNTLLEKKNLLYETTLVMRNGTNFPVENSARVIELSGKTYFQGILRDISERKKAEQQIQYLAHHDSLTGLPNRNLLQDRLTQNLAQARRNGRKSAILFLDFDRFKDINDSLGHSIGDGVLKEVAQRLKYCLRQGDTVARVGGDEFVILMADLPDAQAAATVAQKVTQLGTRPYQVEGQKFRLTISIGISLFPDDGDNIETLLKNADAAMYHAKKSGRDTYYFYQEEMNAQTLQTLKLENELQQALLKKEFELYYQPQIELSNGAVVGVEALLRWNHPERGLVSPDEFIPVAEEKGLIVPIGDWVLETACRQSTAWQQQGLPPVSMAVNISALQLKHADFYNKLTNALDNTWLQPGLLELELTESAVIQGGEQMIALLRELKELGVKLAMDDFGTGYSSLSYLKRFPIDKVKIDRSFIKELPNSAENEAIVGAIIGIANSLKLRVIAEGVETKEQQQFLQRAGCDQIQGFYFSRPLPARQTEELLRARTEQSE